MVVARVVRTGPGATDDVDHRLVLWFKDGSPSPGLRLGRTAKAVSDLVTGLTVWGYCWQVCVALSRLWADVLRSKEDAVVPVGCADSGIAPSSGVC